MRQFADFAAQFADFVVTLHEIQNKGKSRWVWIILVDIFVGISENASQTKNTTPTIA